MYREIHLQFGVKIFGSLSLINPSGFGTMPLYSAETYEDDLGELRRSLLNFWVTSVNDVAAVVYCWLRSYLFEFTISLFNSHYQQRFYPKYESKFNFLHLLFNSSPQ